MNANEWKQRHKHRDVKLKDMQFFTAEKQYPLDGSDFQHSFQTDCTI